MIRIETYRGYTYTVEWWGTFDYTSHVFNGYETFMDNSLESAVRHVQYLLDTWPVHVDGPTVLVEITPDD